MARPSKLTSRKKQRFVLTYDLGTENRSIETRIDVTLEGENGSTIPTPITSLYQARLVPFFSVPKRPDDITLRQLTVCLTDGGTRTVYMPYTPINNAHNDMIREYYQLIPNENYSGLRYRGESINR